MAISRRHMKLLLERLEPAVLDAYLIAVQKATGRAQIELLTRAIIDNNADAIYQAAGIREGMWSQLSEEIRTAYVQSGSAVIAADVPKRLAMEFNANNPRAEAWLRSNSSNLITGRLSPDQVDAIQVALRNGMVKGKNPRSVALDIVGRMGPAGRRTGGVIGLTGQQSEWVLNMADALANTDGVGVVRFNVDPLTGKREAVRSFWIDKNGELKSNYSLRDKRFDPAIKKSIETGKPLPKATRDKITGRYSDRLLKYRGDTIARTETLQAINQASDEALNQIIDEGLAPQEAITRIWRHSFSKNERPGHVMMNGQERGVGEYFTNPITGVELLRPGDPNAGAGEVINCRCYIEHKIDFAMAAQAA